VNYLLPAQTLLDMISAGPTPAHTWSDGIDTRSLRVSVISIAQARAAIMNVADAGERTRLDTDFRALLDQLKADGGPPLPFDESQAGVWEALMLEPALKGVTQSDRMVYATAMAEGLTVVEAARAATRALQKLGVDIVVV
jgi:hypothetical protein